MQRPVAEPPGRGDLLIPDAGIRDGTCQSLVEHNQIIATPVNGVTAWFPETPGTPYSPNFTGRAGQTTLTMWITLH